MLDISAASLQRYQSGDRDAPDAIAERAHYLTSVIAALEGTYNEFGVRRWFERPRSVFNGRTARQLLSRRWTPSDEPARSVLAARREQTYLRRPPSTMATDLLLMANKPVAQPPRDVVIKGELFSVERALQ
jgi:hypothetical protein